VDLERFADSPRWPVIADCLLAFAVLVLQLLSIYFIDGLRNFLTWEVALEVSACAVLLLRRRFPVPVLLWVVAVADVHAWSSHFKLDTVFGPNLFALMVAIYTMATALRTSWVILASAATIVVCTLLPPPDELTPGNLLGIKTWLIVLIISATLGQVQRRSIQRSRRLEQTLGLLDEAHRKLADEAVLVERNRIAREMHDIVAHGLSIIAVRAGVARMVLDTDPAQVAESVGVIEKTSRESLVEMRNMLGVLRRSEEDTGGEPQPGLHRIPELLERARESGLKLEVVRHGEAPDLPPGQQLVAYRLVQEALTNVLKHAGPVRTLVTLRRMPDRICMEVFNETPDGPMPETVRSGHGLVGMRERVGMYGGTVQAGPVDGGFRVTAELPVEAR
jgi:signal transduction histidine kinase